MMRLIDADALMEKAEYDEWYRLIVRAEYIKNAPTIDAELVKHGRWENGTCPNCGQVDFSKPNYCPNCGAKMDREVAP